MRVGALVSSGKDSVYAMYLVMEKGHEVVCMMTVHSMNPDSFMFQSHGVEMSRLQSESFGIPLIEGETFGVKEDELEDLRQLLSEAKEQFELEGIVSGALFSDYQRQRIEDICAELGLESLAPLWHMDQEKELRDILKKGFRFMMVKVAADGLDKRWLGREIKPEDIDKLVKISGKIGMNIAGEGGEYETLMFDGPIFKKKIVIKDSEVVMEKPNLGVFKIIEAKLERK